MLIWILDKNNRIKLSKCKYLLFKEVFLIIIIFSLIFMLASCIPGGDKSTEPTITNSSGVTGESGLYLFDCEKMIEQVKLNINFYYIKIIIIIFFKIC